MTTKHDYMAALVEFDKYLRYVKSYGIHAEPDEPSVLAAIHALKVAHALTQEPSDKIWLGLPHILQLRRDIRIDTALDLLSYFERRGVVVTKRVKQELERLSAAYPNDHISASCHVVLMALAIADIMEGSE